MKQLIAIGVSWLWMLSAFGQVDTAQVFGFDAFMQQVRMHHPVAVQADLQLQRGEATVQSARGAFDPKLGAALAGKEFDDKSYYDKSSFGLKVPTWFGLEVEGGYERNRGDFLNPEATTPVGGQWFAGISVPVGKGLFIDQRRADLRKAELYAEATAAARQQMYNALLLQAGAAYWSWFQAHHVLRVRKDALALARQRYEAVRSGVQLGDRPAIDTLEAGIQVQNRQIALEQAELDVANARQLLSVFLWDEGFVPLELGIVSIPPRVENTAIQQLNPELVQQLDSVNLVHPELQQYRLKLDQQRIERKLKVEQLKPQLDLKYRPLAQSVEGAPTDIQPVNNYMFGAEFSIPILLRKERAAVRLADVYIAETELTLAAKQQEIRAKAQTAVNELATTARQATLYTQTARDYAGLLDGERQLFNRGESSLFLVNSRELGYINAEIKRIELLSKNQLALLKARYSIGNLNP